MTRISRIRETRNRKAKRPIWSSLHRVTARRARMEHGFNKPGIGVHSQPNSAQFSLSDSNSCFGNHHQTSRQLGRDQYRKMAPNKLKCCSTARSFRSKQNNYLKLLRRMGCTLAIPLSIVSKTHPAVFAAARICGSANPFNPSLITVSASCPRPRISSMISIGRFSSILNFTWWLLGAELPRVPTRPRK